MKKKYQDNSQQVFLYPGMALKIGANMQLLTPTIRLKTKTVDNFVDNRSLAKGRSKISASKQNAQKIGS